MGVHKRKVTRRKRGKCLYSDTNIIVYLFVKNFRNRNSFSSTIKFGLGIFSLVVLSNEVMMISSSEIRISGTNVTILLWFSISNVTSVIYDVIPLVVIATTNIVLS